MIYLDNAATSWPKPPEVAQAMTDFLDRAGGNPGRSGHTMSIEAGRTVYAVREQIATLFNAPDPMRVIFTLNGTHALNLALRGLLRPGDRVVAGATEHNAVMRPLRQLEREGVSLALAACRRDGTLDLAALERAVTPGTRLVAMQHAGNVTGTIQPVAEAAAIAHRARALFLLDAAQSAGALPLDMQTLAVDLLAFTGHKSLLGPPGTGGLVLGAGVEASGLAPLYRGGTGSRSESEEQPPDLPDKYESGTPNGVGIAGLGAALSWIARRGPAAIRAHEMHLTQALLDGLRSLPGVTVHGPGDARRCTAVVSFTHESLTVSEIGLRLDEEHGILTRVGLHCAPAAHRTVGTFPGGTVRLAPGPFTTEDEIEAALQAIAEVLRP